jgi:Flp pilus assembly protein TadD
MFSRTKRSFRRGLLLLGMVSVLASGARAQDRAVAPQGSGAGAELRRNLTALALNPRSVTALNGAGRAALEMGDADAALSFFGRASDVDPRNARAKAGMAAALVHLERAGDAISLFAEAISLGASEVEIAADRGLAWDSLGQPGRAQADYALSLRREDDPEVRRRLALSLAISGRREEALRMIEGQLRNRDRAAWRAQAFILALTGDPAGAGQTARDMMPGGADALAPFLARLAGLSPSQKALAVHFGHFPSDGSAGSYARAEASPDPGALAMAQGNAPMGGVRDRRQMDASGLRVDPTAPRRRPGEQSVASQIRPAPRNRVDARPRRTFQVAELQPRRSPPRQAPSAGEAPPWPEPVLDDGQARRTQPQPQPRYQPRQQTRVPAPAQPWAEPVLDESRNPGFTLIPQGRPLGTQAEPTEPAAPPPPEPATDFSSVAAFVNSLPAEEEGALAPPVTAPPVESARRQAAAPRARPAPAPARTRTAEARPGPATTRNSRARSPALVHPSRVWVQMAIGNNKAGLVYTFGSFRRQAPALLGGRGAFTTPWNATNRLLVGPFATEAAARAFVSQLGARGVQAHSWTSDAGQEIDALQGTNDSRTARPRTAQEQRPAAAARTTRNRAGREQQPAVTARTTRSGRAQSAKPPKPAADARASRGRSQPEPGTAARRRRSN